MRVGDGDGDKERVRADIERADISRSQSLQKQDSEERSISAFSSARALRPSEEIWKRKKESKKRELEN